MITVSKIEGYGIYITVEGNEERVFSWEELQHIKDELFPNLGFVEVYPPSNDVINNGNVRHLFHRYGESLPNISDIERECETDFFDPKAFLK